MNICLHGAIALAAVIVLASGCREPNAPPTSAPAATPAAATLAAAPATAGPAAPAASGALGTATLCNIETIDGTAFDASARSVSKPAKIVGWLGSDSGAAPQAPILRLADRNTKAVIRDYPLQLTMERADVVKAFPGKLGLERSGFEVLLDPTGLSAVAGHLYLVYQDGASGFGCDNGRHVDIAGT